MKVLVKCKLYFLMLLAALLLTVGPVASDDQTDPSTGDTMQMTQKPTIMILGSWHFSSSGLDAIKREFEKSV